MSSNPKISVVMICYNHEKYIAEAINSILAQTYTDFELIVVDDGSSDNTLKIIQGYTDPRIIVVEQENSGPSIALNTGISRSHEQFIAFMSGDDVSFSNRLMMQFDQSKLKQADMVFCLPQIIDPNSKILDDAICPSFFNKYFDNTEELYRRLFYYGNFLCASSCFCRRSALEKIGWFKRGLIQLQDFDYWIRACKKDLVIKFFQDRLIQYRYLYGKNLSDEGNFNRSEIETLTIYRSFFEEVPSKLFLESFNDKISVDHHSSNSANGIDISFLFLEHPNPLIRTIGMERLIDQLEGDHVYENLKVERAFDATNLFQITRSAELGKIHSVGRIKKILVFLRNWIFRNLQFIFSEGPCWTDEQVKQHIQYYLEKGDRKRAIMVAKGYRRFPPGPTLFATMLKVFNKVFVKTLLIPLYKLVVRTYTKISQLPTNIRQLYTKIRQRPLLKFEDVFSISSMYTYSKKKKILEYEEAPETIFIKKPNVIGNFTGVLVEGETNTPQPYISIIDHATIVGGSNFVISPKNTLLSDEMIDFSSEDFGIKSYQIIYRYKNDAILTYKYGRRTHIKEGILLSCDHDNNYFHWLVEVLPKFLFVDQFEEFRDKPLLITGGIHKNLLDALDKVNIYAHPLIKLDSGTGYTVDRLIFPSPLSRIVDRYKGQAAFDTDIILSHKWVSRVAERLTKEMQSQKTPCRKVFLPRNPSYRNLGNQNEIEQILQKSGFESIKLENVSLDYQINLFSEVAVLVAPTGAAVTNILFCQPGTKVIIFMSNHETTNFYFWSELANIANVDMRIIAGQRSFILTNYYSVHDDYMVDPKTLIAVLNEIL